MAEHEYTYTQYTANITNIYLTLMLAIASWIQWHILFVDPSFHHFLSMIIFNMANFNYYHNLAILSYTFLFIIILLLL